MDAATLLESDPSIDGRQSVAVGSDEADELIGAQL